MRYIRNISDDQNKSGDTDNIFRFNLLQGEDIFNFGDYPISINIANSSGYILSMVPEKEFGNSVVKLDFNDQSLKSLTPDNYLLEVEVKFPDGTTATFPTKGGMPFTVNSNLKNTAGHLVPTVTFDEVLSAVDKKVNNYLATVVKGDKGDTGVVDTAKDYTWTGTNTFNKKIIAPAGVQGNADTATQLQTARRINGTAFDGTADINVNAANDGSLVHKTGDEIIAGFKKFSGNIATTSDNSMINGGGQNGDIAFVKKSGSSGLISIGSSNWFTVRQSGNTSISPSDTLKDYFVVKPTGVITAGLNQDLVPLDKNVIHNTGTETVAGDKTFTGSSIFTQLIDGYTKTSVAPNTDLNLITKQGKYMVDNSFTNIPNGLPNSSVLLVENNTINTIRFQFILSRDPDDWNNNVAIFLRSQVNNIWTPWRKFAKDENVVHNTGTETVAGDKTFTGNNTFTGKTSFWFKQIQWTSGIMQGTWYIQRMGNWVNAKFDMSANTGTGTTTLTLPVGYRPLSQFVRDLEQGGAGISQNGTVLVANSYTGSNAMTFSYPTNDVWPTA